MFVGCLGVGLNLPRNVDRREPDESAGRRIATTLDPNTAPWYELAQLPRIGPTLAHRIVAYRESAAGGPSAEYRVFRGPADLAGVGGIGPRTIDRIGRYLHFSKRDPTPGA